MHEAPHITVASVVQQAGRFLMVKENADGRTVYNQPAGHLELGESLIAAAERETLEETGWRVRATAFLGIYHYTSQHNGSATYDTASSPIPFAESLTANSTQKYWKQSGCDSTK